MNHYTVKFSYDDAPSIEITLDELSHLDTDLKRKRFINKLLKHDYISEVKLITNL